MWPFFTFFVIGKSSIQTDRRIIGEIFSVFGGLPCRGEKAGQWQKSLQFFDDMLKAVVAPDDAFCFGVFVNLSLPPLHNVPPSPEIRLPRPYYTLISRGYVEGVGLLAMILEAFVFLEAFFFSQYEGVGKEVQKNGRVRSWYDIPLGDKGCFRPWKLEASSSLAEIISLDQMDHPNKTK